MEATADLRSRSCVPCKGGEAPLGPEEIERNLALVPEWRATDQPRLVRTFRFKNFKQAMVFVDRMAEIAEEEGHHPDFFVHWNEVRVELWTHKTGGLHLNDFIMAAKIDAILSSQP